MSDPTLAVNPSAPATAETVQPTVQVTPPAQQTEEVHPAVKRINEDKAALQAENDELKAKLKQAELDQLPEEDQIEEGFREMYSERAISAIPAADFAKLPPIIQRQLIDNPWAFTPQADIDQATTFAGTQKEYFTLALPLAIANIKQLISENGSTAPDQKGATKDPSISTGGDPSPEQSSYSRGELMVIAQTDPKRYQEIMKAARGN